MALVRRQKGEAVLLPDGVVARMQLSPYRIQLAGIRTAPAGFRPLDAGMVDLGPGDATRRRGRRGRGSTAAPAPWVGEGTRAEISCPDAGDGGPIAARVRSLAREARDGGEFAGATVAVDRPPDGLRTGMVAGVRFLAAVAEMEPFRSMPRNPPVPAPGEPRRLYACADHADSTGLEPGPCPLDRKEREPRVLGELERVRWWCPCIPTSRRIGPEPPAAHAAAWTLRPRVIVYAPPGQVLAVPQSAVVNTGERKVVFVEGMPGMFDGIEVVLGSRCGDVYPVIRGIEPGQPVAIAGAFLLDAETRLNPSLAAGYFGAGGGRRAVADADPGRWRRRRRPARPPRSMAWHPRIGPWPSDSRLAP